MPSVAEALSQHGSFFVRIEIERDNGTWLDLTDRVDQNRLRSLPGLSARRERSLGAAEVTLGSIRLDNADGYFTNRAPSGIRSWLRKRLRVSLVSGDAVQQLCVVQVDDVACDAEDGDATLALSALSRRLIDKEADRTRNGRDWFTNRPAGLLVRELLMQEFTRDEVTAWTGIVDRHKIPLADPSARALSPFGRPPEYDGTIWREDGTTLYGSPYAVNNTVGSTGYGMHWVGIGGELWRYDPATDVWTKWAGMPVGRTAFKIFHIYLNPARSRVICVGWEPDCPTPTPPLSSRGDRSGAKSGDVAVLYCSAATAPGTLSEFSGKPSNIYTGHYFVRAGGTAGTTVSCGAPTPGTADANCYGINLPVPFGHWTLVHYANQPPGPPPPPYTTNASHKTTHAGKADAAEQGAGIEANVTWALDSPGYYAPWDSGALGVLPLDYRWSVGQYRGAFAHQNAGDDFVCSVISWDSGISQYKFRIWTLNTNNGTWTDTGLFVMGDLSGSGAAHHFAPSSFAFRADDARLLVAATRWKETAWTAGAPVQTGACEPFGSMIVEWTYALTDSAAPAGRPVAAAGNLNTNHAVGSFPERFWSIFIDAIYGATDYVLAVGLDARGVLSSTAFFAQPIRLSTVGFGMPLRSSGRIAGAVYEATSGRWFVHNAGGNQLRSLMGNSVATTTDWALEDSGFPPVSGDESLLMGLVLDKKQGAIFGVSGPGSGGQCNPELMNNAALSGKYYLWQFAGWLTDRVELADFSGMKVWDALEELSSFVGAVFGFDRLGDFYFRPRATTFVPTMTLVRAGLVEGTRYPLARLARSHGFRKLFNVAEITPSAATLAPPTGAVRILARPTGFGRDPWSYAPEIVQTNNRNLNLFLRCVAGGQVGSPDDGCVRKTRGGLAMVDYSPGGTERIHKLRFAFQMYDSLVETQLVAPVIPTDKIRIPLTAAKDVRAVETGIADVQAREETDEVLIGDTELYTVRSRTDYPALGESELRLNKTITTAWPAWTKVTIRTRGNNRWSDSAGGVTSANLNLSAGSLGGLTTFDVFSTRNLAPGMVISIDEDGREEMRIVSVNSATSITVRRGVGGTVNAVHVGVAPIRAYWAPIVSAEFPDGYRFQIGGSGVSLRFSGLPDAGEDPFMIGDTIEIVCPGLSLEAQAKAKIVAFNTTSIERLNGSKLPWQTSRNIRFAGYRQAQEAARRIVNEYGYPHFEFSAEAPLGPFPDLDETVLIEDARGVLRAESAVHSPNGDFPPVAPDTSLAVGAVVEAYTLDPMNDRVTLEMRAVNPHDY